ncbi:MAG: phosphopyruvate hydratase [Rhodothermales bacterium]
MPVIQQLEGFEILDSRGRPTVSARCVLASGAVGQASVPSGASSGAAEAHEWRDGDPSRYGGLGCRQAALHIDTDLAGALIGHELADQADLDTRLIALDGTPNKGRLGANALLAVSIAFCRAEAAERRLPLFVHLADRAGSEPALPRLTINLFSGGLHAGGQVPIQDTLVVPVSAGSIDDGLAMTYAVYQAAARLAKARYGYRLLRADEGGLAPPFPGAEAMFDMAVEAIEAAGLRPGADMALAIDVAASHFYADGRYALGGAPRDSDAMIETVAGWVDAYPIVSVEDGLAEEDWSSWPLLHDRLRHRARTVGDDLLCTNPTRIARAIAIGAADTLLLKVNQIGTLTEAAEARRLAREAGWQVTVSARSGETEDNWLADLAVGWAGNQIKIGSITQSERLSKYNRLLEIERLGSLGMEAWPG